MSKTHDIKLEQNNDEGHKLIFTLLMATIRAGSAMMGRELDC